jgi:hypothetical protein
MTISHVIIFPFPTFLYFVARNFSITTPLPISFVSRRARFGFAILGRSRGAVFTSDVFTIRANHANCYRFGNISIRFFKMDYVELPARRMMCTME